jgi:hypothetical protein
MLRRAKRLRRFFVPFCTELDRLDLALDDEEWRQIDYLLLITEPFFVFTNELSKTKDATTHLVFRIYNKLFRHLEKSIAQLRQKRTMWKKQMLQALHAAREKLDQYYADTDNIRGDLYAVSTMLAPSNKLKFFLSTDWNASWRTRYRKSLEQSLIPYQQRLAKQQTLHHSPSSARMGSRLDLLLSEDDNQSTLSHENELSQYLDSGMYEL